MRRTLFTFAAALSAVLCAGLCVLWVRSYSVADEWGWGRRPDAHVTVLSVYGRVWSEYIKESGYAGGAIAPPGPTGYHAMPVRGDPMKSWKSSWSCCGFEWTKSDPDPTATLQTLHELLAIPHWALVLATGTPPGLWLLTRWRRRRLRPSGHCTVCGYDVRATPDRCPECGTAVPAKPAAIPT